MNMLSQSVKKLKDTVTFQSHDNNMINPERQNILETYQQPDA